MEIKEIVTMDARAMARHILEGDISAEETVSAHISQIERMNPQINAICTLVADMAMESAKKADQMKAAGEVLGPLHGIPVPIKDLTATKGIRTTWGSPIYRDTVPAKDELVVERLKSAGAIIIGKSNTPEFGAGSHTFNQVFGTTRNPYDTSKTCGGSSGGAAAAVACGMAPLAEGSDFGGSLRNPAAWCNVVGFRPTQGRVPRHPIGLGWSTLSVNGPIARTVKDAALMFSVMAGPDDRFPVSLPESGEMFSSLPPLNTGQVRVAWSNSIGNRPVEPVINDMLKGARRVMEDIGCIVEDAEPDLSDSDYIFDTIRAYGFAHTHENHLKYNRSQLKETVIWNTEQGMKLSALDYAKAEEKRTALWQRMVAFWEKYDYLCLPATSLPPFPIEWEYPEEIDGVKMETYTNWMWPCYVITVTGSPAISVPGGFTPDGLPVGLQIVGKPKNDIGVLQIASAFEDATGFYRRRPLVAI